MKRTQRSGPLRVRHVAGCLVEAHAARACDDEKDNSQLSSASLADGNEAFAAAALAGAKAAALRHEELRMANKGKPSKQQPDQRAEMEKEQASPGAARTTHRTDRSRDMEKGGKGPEPLKTHGPTIRHPSESNKLPRSKINH